MNNQTSCTSPSQLWIGNHENLVKHIEEQLQKFLCKQNGCTACVTCRQIERHEHHSVFWFTPEKSSYNVEQLDPLFETISRMLDPHEHVFFVLQYADALNQSCSNKLLKSMEEPPAGYHFILLTEHKDTILPTIRSRCIEHRLSTGDNRQEESALYSVFTQSKTCGPLEFLKILDESHIDEYTTRRTITQLHELYSKQYSRERSSGDLACLRLLEKAMIKLPMPGSSNLFWKNLFLLWDTNRK